MTRLLAHIVLSATAALIFNGAARAQLTIEIIGGGAQQIPITVLPFGGEDRFTQRVSQVVSADLARSGMFRLGSHGSVRPFPTEAPEVDYRYWKNEGTQTLVIGRVIERADGKLEVRFRMLDIAKQSQVLGYSFTVAVPQLRLTAHKIADLIYEKLTGDIGVFATKICYVVKSGELFELQVADADGFSPQVVHRYKEPIISPQWSPDGSRIAYVSFEQKKPIVYVLNVFDGTRKVVANFEGSNSAPAWSPDGRRLAVTLTKDGTSQIYLMHADGSGLERLTFSNSIDTEPNFSPDGRYLLFTSDRAGSPQIYRMRVDGSGEPERMTYEGSYNVTPRHSPDGKSFVFIHRSEGRFNVAVQDLATRQVQVLTSGNLDQSPTFAPNGKMILYASEIRGRGILAAVSSDGRIKQRITAQAGDIREPAWGPLLDNRRKESER
ncbi:MAG TPA: Tol-Pal system beta propeller repeat protein TolB [Burkholderiales bacterium]|jgi:TolB protein|nr:Tol-Pal system beta propeller repeat protein TolB [Burkholderiales bacterium]